jgi:mannose-1-phosphate guanylyltransferase
VVKAQLYAEKYRNNFIKTVTDKKVVISGLENFIIVDSDGLLMICPMDKNQEVKNLAEKASKHFEQKEG